MTLQHDDPFVTVDVETAGFSPKNGFLLEVGLCFVAGGKIVGKLERLIRPSCKWERHPLYLKSRQIHRISTQEIRRHGRPEADVAAEIHGHLTRFAEDHGPPRLVAHNASFERRWLTDAPWCFPFDHDSLQIARERRPDLASHKLAELVDAYGIAWSGPAHRALPDAVATAEVVLRMLAPAVQPAPELPEGAAGQVPPREQREPEPEPEPPPDPPPPLRPDADRYDVAGFLAEHAPTLARWANGQLGLEGAKSRGEAADELLPATLAGLRALLVRYGGDPALVRPIHDAVGSLTGAPRFRRRHPPKVNTKALRLWAGERLEPVSTTSVGVGCAAGAVYRRPSGELIALTNDEIARLEAS